ncbi:ABC-2 type transport system ATP-binding protein [Marininema mesophilum]|uniref:ABC-2 type transport system ATP-binding protein n=1 Tax=Marininema mesophilum TaxID=1048340 RepID=A0A1H2QV71_9BACL|nr:ABC transporter ATP-binding protein [Marininema mesophilum]SDW11082.1 ABC-2 type transport system ATP-binding protein [Marininema mesophilum]
MIQLQSITKKFGDYTAVDQVNLSVEQGEICGLIGANGAGKTTLIRMMCGLLLPDGGEGRVLGFDIRHQQKAIRQQIGYMSQKFSLYPDLTVEENLRFYAALYGIHQGLEKRIASQIEAFRLEEVRQERVGRLPGGWLQRVAFASAQLHSPPLLFLDEPTSGVDPVTRRAFWEQLYRLADEGTTILVTTHVMDEAERCDHITMMNQGEVVAEGAVNQLKKEFARDEHTPLATLDELFIQLTGKGDHDGG